MHIYIWIEIEWNERKPWHSITLLYIFRFSFISLAWLSLSLVGDWRKWVARGDGESWGTLLVGGGYFIHPFFQSQTDAYSSWRHFLSSFFLFYFLSHTHYLFIYERLCHVIYLYVFSILIMIQYSFLVFTFFYIILHVCIT
jgi:hypothetical protein